MVTQGCIKRSGRSGNRTKIRKQIHGPSFNQRIGRLISALLALVDESLSKTPNPQLLAAAVSRVCDCESFWRKASAKCYVKLSSCNHIKYSQELSRPRGS